MKRDLWLSQNSMFALETIRSRAVYDAEERYARELLCSKVGKCAHERVLALTDWRDLLVLSVGEKFVSLLHNCKVLAFSKISKGVGVHCKQRKAFYSIPIQCLRINYEKRGRIVSYWEMECLRLRMKVALFSPSVWKLTRSLLRPSSRQQARTRQFTQSAFLI